MTDSVLDIDREDRLGFPEVIYAAGKPSEVTVKLFRSLLDANGRAMATRCSAETRNALKTAFARIDIDERAQVAVCTIKPKSIEGKVAVLAAGTSDIPIAEEAALTVEFAGLTVDRFFDVGVAGIHRLIERLDKIRVADVVIVVAGMEGALPSVVGGLVGVPVIAVPTSVGYGTSFGGLSAILGMLNSCSPGITVVNIDNGFGAGVAAFRILNRRK